jgi:hypothetical protein
MAAAESKRMASAPDAETLSFAEIYEHVYGRAPSALPEHIKEVIKEAWRDGRLPLVASEERCYRSHAPLRPLIFRKRPSPDDHDIEVVAGVVCVIPKREEGTEESRVLWESRGAYLPASPGDLPTVIDDPVYERSLADPPAPNKPIEELKDQLIPANISFADIKFAWVAESANWHDKATGAITLFLGIKAKRTDVERLWPRQARVGGRPSSGDLIREEAEHQLREGPLPKSFKEFANVLSKWLATNHPQAPSMSPGRVEKVLTDLRQQFKKASKRRNHF